MVLDADAEESALTSGERLAVELRRLRRMAGLSGRELARRVEISQSKVSRIEAGRTLPSLAEVTAWAEAVAASPRQRRWLVTCAEAAFTEVTAWRTSLYDRTHLQDLVRDRESEATRLQVFQPSVVPGLLQTPQYARRLFSQYREIPYGKDQLAAAMAGRLSRQLALHEETRSFDFLITEAALRWRPGPASLMRAQLDRIASLSTLDNIGVGLIPQNIQAVAYTSHAFTILRTPDRDPYVSVETIHAELTVHEPRDVRLYETRWDTLSSTALYGTEARAFLDELRSGLDTAEGAR